MTENNLINLDIKEPSLQDVGEMSDLINQLGYRTTVKDFKIRYSNISSRKDYKTLVAYEDDKVVGMVGLQHCFYYECNGTYIRILALVVNNKHRGKGVATKLLEASEAWAKSVGASTLALNCGNREEREQAHRLYQRLGFKARSTGYSKALK